MKLLSEYMSEDGKKTAKVYFIDQKAYSVVLKDDMGTHYKTVFMNLQMAEDYAEDYVL